LRTTPEKKPRTECGCHPVAFMIAAIVAPSLFRSMAITRSCLDTDPLLREGPAAFRVATAALVAGDGLDRRRDEGAPFVADCVGCASAEASDPAWSALIAFKPAAVMPSQ